LNMAGQKIFSPVHEVSEHAVGELIDVGSVPRRRYSLAGIRASLQIGAKFHKLIEVFGAIEENAGLDHFLVVGLKLLESLLIRNKLKFAGHDSRVID
jgi:hypothetical protein